MMIVKEKDRQNFIVEVMNTSLFSMDEKFKIIERFKDNNLNEEDISQILDVIQKFNEGALKAINRYYSNMDKVYAQYLEKNISQLKQNMGKITLEVKEEKVKESEWDSDLILDKLD